MILVIIHSVLVAQMLLDQQLKLILHGTFNQKLWSDLHNLLTSNLKVSHSFMTLTKSKRNKLMLMINYLKLSILLTNKRKLSMLKNKPQHLPLLKSIMLKHHMMHQTNNILLPQLTEMPLKKDSEMPKVHLKLLNKT